jgi:hypothetical protein
MGKGQRFTEEFRVEAVSSDSVIRRAYRLKILKIIIHWLLMLFTLSAGAVLVEGYDISKSWGRAVVFVPSSSFAKTVTDVKTEKPMPVVILMHVAVSVSTSVGGPGISREKGSSLYCRIHLQYRIEKRTAIPRAMKRI